MLNSLNFKIFFEMLKLKVFFFLILNFLVKIKNVFVLNLIVYYVFCKKNFIV